MQILVYHRGNCASFQHVASRACQLNCIKAMTGIQPHHQSIFMSTGSMKPTGQVHAAGIRMHSSSTQQRWCGFLKSFRILNVCTAPRCAQRIPTHWTCSQCGCMHALTRAHTGHSPAHYHLGPSCRRAEPSNLLCRVLLSCSVVYAALVDALWLFDIT